MLTNTNVNVYTWLVAIAFQGSTALEVYFLGRIREDAGTRDARQRMGMSRHTHRRAVSAHTLNAEGLSAATSTLFPTWLQKRWQPVPDPPCQETEILFSEECYHPMRTNLKILTLGGSPINGPLKSLFCTDKVPVQSSQAPHMLSFPCVLNQE